MILATLATGCRGRARRAAFSLIELSIVVFIIAILMAIALPSFVRSYNGMILTDAARSFATICQMARIDAVSQQQTATVHINLDRQMFWLTQTVRGEDGVREERRLKVIELSNRIALVDAVRTDGPVTGDKQIDVDFYPNGTCDPVYIILQGTERGGGLCAVIDPITIRANIYPVKL